MLDPDTPAGDLGAALDRPRPGVAVLTVSGEVDTLTAPPFERAVGALLADPADTVLVLDLEAVQFLASSGLAVLIRAAHRAAERELRLRLVASGRAVRRPLEITGSDRLFDLYADRNAAVGPSV